VRKAGDSMTLARLALARGVVAFFSLAAMLPAGCGRSELEDAPALPRGSEIPMLPVFGQSVNSDLDIIFLIDNSGSMKEEQANVSRNFPVFMGELDALPEGIPNVHIGVLSSDMGAGRFVGIEGCDRLGGDAGVFQARPRAQGGICAGAPKTGNFLSAVGSKRNFDGNISDALSCIAELGTSGCGFEHPLASIRRALGGDGMAAPRQNEGFLRDGALLAIVIITDEDDCSAPPDTDLFDPAQQRVTDPLGPLDSYRCNEFGHLCGGKAPPRTMEATNLADCHSNEDGAKLIRVADVVSFLKSLKATPDDVLVAAITGPSTPYSVQLRQVRNRSGGFIQDEPRIVPSCRSANGSASPSVRIKEFIDAFGTNGTIESICDSDFSPAMARIGDKIAGRFRHQCVEGPLVDRDRARPGMQANCEVFQETATANGMIRTSLRSCDDVGTPCWHVQADDTCPGTRQEIVVDRGAVPAAPHTRITVLCETCTDPQDPRCVE
jgi:hypothetical protein